MVVITSEVADRLEFAPGGAQLTPELRVRDSASSLDRAIAARLRAAQISPWLVLAGTPVAGGLLAGGHPAQGLLLLVALAAVPHVVVRPEVALAVLAIVELSNASEVAGKHSGLSLYLITLALSVAALLFGLRGQWSRMPWSPVFLLAAMFVAARAVTIFVATDPSVTFSLVVEYLKDLIFLVTATGLIVITGSLRRVVEIMVGTIALLAGLTLFQQFVLHNSNTLFGFSRVLPADIGSSTMRHTGPDTDPNYWARTLVLFLPLALSLWAARQRGRVRWLWLAAAAVIAGGVLLTSSRGGLIALGAAAVAWLILVGPPERRLMLGLPLAITVLLAAPNVGSRLATLSQLSAARTQAGDVSLVGRVEALRAGQAMFNDHKALGVGAGNFTLLEPDYQRRLGFSVTRDLAPHNLYVEMAAEGGLVGIGAWLLFYGGLVWLVVRALLVARGGVHRRGRSSAELFSVGLLASLVGFSVASVFLQLAHFRYVLLMGAVIAAVDRAGGGVSLPERRPADGHVVSRRFLVVACVVLAVLDVGYFPARTTAWRASVRGSLRPVSQVRSGSEAYQYDVLTRTIVLPTFAALVGAGANDRPALHSLGDPTGNAVRLSVSPIGVTGVIAVVATSHRRDLAETAATKLFDQGRSRIEGLHSPFELVPVVDKPSRAERVSLWSRPRVIAVVGFAVLIVTLCYGAWRAPPQYGAPEKTKLATA